MDNDKAHVLDVLLAAEAAVKFLGSTSRDDFFEDELLQSSIMWQIGIMGTATQKISDIYKEQNNGIEWHKIAGMRNHLVHGYRKINFTEVWDTVTRDLPPLIKKLKLLVK
ncbi:MAG: DUF86 domain-containing protein [Calditrichaeota bacterium]|nr:DUF86 domain-containing protein [Calditrichota bacterium]